MWHVDDDIIEFAAGQFDQAIDVFGRDRAFKLVRFVPLRRIEIRRRVRIFSPRAVENGTSFLAGRIDEPVTGDQITIYDDGWCAAG